MWAIYGQRLARGLQTVVYHMANHLQSKSLKDVYAPQAYFINLDDSTADIPILKDKNDAEKARIYVCDMEACRLADDNIKGVLQVLRKDL
jgi:uncharacterized protein YyaL (SSP411 family)